MNLKKLEEIIFEMKQPNYRLDQIKRAVYRDGTSSFSEISSLPKDLRELLDEKIKILSFDAKKVLVAKDGCSVKALLKLKDGNFTETVLISAIAGSWSACISSQVGCPLGCGFCATGLMGFKRNLTAEEISDQILFWRQYLKAKNLNLKSKNSKGENTLSNIVYMGMGEPFLNWENVRDSLRMFTQKDLFGLGSRSLSVSTAGISDMIEKFADEFPQVNLAVSLHFADEAKRSEYMPINRNYNLEKLRASLKKYFLKTKRKVFLEYIMLDEANDSEKDAKKLVKYIQSIGNIKLLHVNLIRYNSISNSMNPSSKEKTVRFKNFLLESGINVTIRKSLGQDIQGACGQLAGRDILENEKN